MDKTAHVYINNLIIQWNFQGLYFLHRFRHTKLYSPNYGITAVQSLISPRDLARMIKNWAGAPPYLHKPLLVEKKWEETVHWKPLRSTVLSVKLFLDKISLSSMTRWSLVLHECSGFTSWKVSAYWSSLTKGLHNFQTVIYKHVTRNWSEFSAKILQWVILVW